MQSKQRITILLCFLCCIIGAAAQQLSVSSFKCLRSDMDARINHSITNHNGKKCAIIKVVNSNSGFAFETGTLSVEKVVPKVGEIWVYVQPGVRKITIKHPTLGILREYIFPERIEEATVYELVLESGRVHTYVEQAPMGAYLAMRLSPANATVWIDDEIQTTMEGAVMVFLANGEHTYRVQAAGYDQEVGKLEISGERKDMQVTLKSNKAVLKLSCADANALLYVDGKLVGSGQWQGEIVPGSHIIEVKRDGYHTQTKQIDLRGRETSEQAFSELIAITGLLQVASPPIDSEVWLDGNKVGTTPYGPSKALAGTHKLEIRKAGYQTFTKDIVITEGETCLVNNALEKEKTVATNAVATDNVAGNNGKIHKFTVKGVTFEMVEVEGGTFTMGATPEQGSDAFGIEKPAHKVTLSSYMIGRTEVTQALWQAVMGKNPSHWTGDNLPVEMVSWNDCREFIRKLNALTGKTFRLPTEAEWEYAARGGSRSRGYKYSGSNNLGEVAWFRDNSSSTTHPVGTKKANELGIYDMNGNVREWCSDKYGKYSSSLQTNPTGPSSGSYRVIRGGSWLHNSRGCRVSDRFSYTPDDRDSYLGLRLVLDISEGDNASVKEKTAATDNVAGNNGKIHKFTVKGVTFEMVEVEGGTFTMGATPEQGSDAFDDEKPVHKVTLSSYMIGRTEVTQALWKAVMGNNLSGFKGDNLPVEMVTWNDCQEFIRKLNALTGKRFRLPTEAEWEYAARGGSRSCGYKYSGSNNVDEVAWLKDNSSSTTHPVGTKKANELGIYDMNGNVWEWCNDWYGEYSSSSQTNPTGPSSGISRVLRGGSWGFNSRYCRVSGHFYNSKSPDSRFIDYGFRLVLDISEGDNASVKEKTSATDNAAGNNDKIHKFTVKGVTFEMVEVEGGTFTMGATAEQGSDAYSNEKPAHKVTLSSYMIGRTEVTQALWQAVMGKNPSYRLGDNLPVEQVSWNDCQEFIRKLNALTGKTFRLPTEAEWEYAARGGKHSRGYKYSGSNNVDEVAWLEDNSNKKTHPVGTKKANELGIYDMSGNVREWCSDWYDDYSSSLQTNPKGPSSGSGRVIRGGSRLHDSRFCRVADRYYNAPDDRYIYLGLRLVLVP